MIKKFLSGLKSNWGYKILSFAIAIVIWYAVVDVNDPVETDTFTVKVTVTNESYIANGKQVYSIDDTYKQVTAYVKGNRSVLSRLSADDITVTADLTQIVDLNREPVEVPLSVSCPNISAGNITLSRQTIPINIENVASKKLAVSVSCGDSVPGSSYEVGTMTPDPETIVVNGPESIVNTITSAVAQIDVTGMTQDGERKATLQFLDQSGNALSDDTVSDDLTFDGDISEVTVQVDLWKKVNNVGLNVEYSGKPAAGYNVESVTTTPETISVVGNDAALEELAAENNTITISDESVSVDGASTDQTFNVPISDNLPEGLRLTTNEADTVTVNITILSDETKEIKVDVDDISPENLASTETVSYDTAEITVRVTGPEADIEDLTADDIKVYIDLNGLTSGDYSVPVRVESLPDDVTAEGQTISIHLKEKATTPAITAASAVPTG
ncbi:MAG: CdaR family protein [Eubacteriales bacterium]